MRYAATWLIVATAVFLTSSEVIANTSDEISEAYLGKYRVIDTILVESDVTIYSMIGDAELFRRFGTMPNLTGKQVVIAGKDSRIYIQQIIPWEEVAPTLINELAAIDPEIRKNPERIRELDFNKVTALAQLHWEKEKSNARGKVLLFDGQKLLETRPGVRLTTDGVERTSFRIVNSSTHSTRYLPETVLDAQLFSFKIPGMPSESEYRAKNRLPEIWQQEGFRLPPSIEFVDNVECVAFGSKESMRLFLISSLGFAVKRREWYLNGELVYSMNATDFQEVAEDIWLPRTMNFIQYAHRDYGGGDYSGKPTHRIEYRVKNMNINAVENSKYFTIEVPAGSWVVDETVPMLDKDGKPLNRNQARRAVSYLQPADQTDLERVIKDAQKHSPTAPVGIRKPSSIPTFVLLNVAVIVAIAVLIAFRKYKR